MPLRHQKAQASSTTLTAPASEAPLAISPLEYVCTGDGKRSLLSPMFCFEIPSTHRSGGKA